MFEEKASDKTFMYIFFFLSRFVHDIIGFSKCFIVLTVSLLFAFKTYNFFLNMGSEQQGDTSHHFLTDSSRSEEYQTQKRNSILWTKNERIPVSKQPAKPSWQLARDASMEMLSRKTTKLNVKQGKKLFLIVGKLYFRFRSNT
jgi:hypothetical protein